MAQTIVIAAGGPAAHVVPAVAVAAALRADGAEVVFVGGERADRTLVPAAGYELRPIAVEGLSRTNPVRAARALARAGAAVATARRILRELRPGAVVGGGRRPRAARPHRGRQPPGPDQPRAGAVRAPRLSGLPGHRARRRPLPGQR